jgi:hypothetical protein
LRKQRKQKQKRAMAAAAAAAADNDSSMMNKVATAGERRRPQAYATRRATRIAKLHASAGGPLGSLPADVVDLLGDRLFSLEEEDRLNCLPTWTRDVANIALSCKCVVYVAAAVLCCRRRRR